MEEEKQNEEREFPSRLQMNKNFLPGITGNHIEFIKSEKRRISCSLLPHQTILFMEFSISE